MDADRLLDLRLVPAAATGWAVTAATVLWHPGAAVLEPGQSARIAFRVQEPAASTVAFTFDFL